MCCYSDRTVSAISYTDFLFSLLYVHLQHLIFDILLSFLLIIFTFFYLLLTLKDKSMSIGFGKQTNGPKSYFPYV